MKTLINKANPEIRITAPEIEVHEEERIFLISGGNYCNIDDWTLVEEEPEKQTSEYFKEPDYDKKVVKKMSKELAKIITDQIAEPVDLEKEINKRRTMLLDLFGSMNGEQCLAVKNFARHFYELGRKGR